MLFDFRERRVVGGDPRRLRDSGRDPAADRSRRGRAARQRARGGGGRHRICAVGTPVFTGGADTQCALLGAGAVEAGDVAAILGTTTPMQAVVGEPLLDPAGNLWAGCHVVPDRWVIESNAGSTGDAYLWLLDLLVPGWRGPPCARRGARRGGVGRGGTSRSSGRGSSTSPSSARTSPGGPLLPLPDPPAAAECRRAVARLPRRASATRCAPTWRRSSGRRGPRRRRT